MGDGHRRHLQAPRRNNELREASTEECKKIPGRFQEWPAEIFCHSAILGWAAEHIEGDSRNFAGMFLHNFVDFHSSSRLLVVPSDQVFGVCCPRPDSTPSANPSDVIVNGPGNKVEVDENDDEESEFPIEAQINSNCGQRFVGGRIVNGKVTRKHELPFMVRNVEFFEVDFLKTCQFIFLFKCFNIQNFPVSQQMLQKHLALTQIVIGMFETFS